MESGTLGESMVLGDNWWNTMNSTLIIVEGLTDKGFIEGIKGKRTTKV
jgi:hypothetical protein